MSYLSTQHDDPAPLISQTKLASILSLPHELAQSILGLITNFEPWTYSSIPERADATITDEKLVPCTQDAMPLNMTCINRYMLGLSGGSGWLILMLSRHRHRFCRSKHDGISSAVTQALSRANAPFKKLHWKSRESSSCLQIREDSGAADCPNSNFTELNKSSAEDDTLRRPLTKASMVRYHTSVHSEEEAYLDEQPEIRRSSALQDADDVSSPATALILYDPTPTIKLTKMDTAELASRSDLSKTEAQIYALLVAVLVTLTQCRISLLEALDKLERDTSIQSIEPYESKDFAAPRMSPRLGRPRSLSGSTVADVQPHEELLSFSAVSTVYSSENTAKRVQWEGRDEEVVSPKRPKLSQYKQVSSGRVATLMDRFEKFHL
ncbi:uncharacterized protein EKO05_0007105 [Ascochyta rabiei]|uniref:Uncharacterized protein n=1 Tax=Didymella rabiei TaxID=5454 RepID=A0A163G3I3_DIDRA|nr:uncharacterized protein EKO05_0007105 [Ascochyta rabiei]KZM24660.1 hypothetical protein ST47_g4149 [Ascochyta rabiei]UPX16717.1 hypothetical protein EKO05_0007105 [Ascochyta rabiei]